MARILASLIEENRDFRNQEVTLLFTLINSTSKCINVLSVNPYFPDGVKLIETHDFSLLSVKKRHEILCTELNELAMDYLVVESEEFRKKLLDSYSNIWKLFTKEMTGYGFFWVLRFYWRLIVTRKFAEELEQEKRRSYAYFVKIEDSNDAKVIYENFITSNENYKSLSKIFSIKIEKLVEYEASLNQVTSFKAASIAQIDGGEEFSVRYLLRFPRRIFDSTSFTVSVESIYGYDGLQDQQYAVQSTQTINVPPNSISLSFVAVIAALLGVILKYSFALINLSDANHGIELQSVVAQAVAASVLAFIVFNIFEFTDMFKSLHKRLSWRQAMFIGVLCGLGLDRIFEALKALVGANIGG